MNRGLICFFYMIGITLLLLKSNIYKLEATLQPHNPTHYLKVVMPVLYCLFFAFLIIEQVFSKRSLFKIDRIPFLSALGKISYGLYCFHMISMFIVVYVLMKFDFNVLRPGKQLILLEITLSFFLTVLFSAVSYRYLERPFLSLKEKLTMKSFVENPYKAHLKQEVKRG